MSADASDEPAQHSLWRSLSLHLAAGVAILLVYIALQPLVRDLGYHAEFAMYLAFLVGGIALPLLFLYWLGKKRNGSRSLRGIVVYREKIPKRQYWVVAACVVGFVVYAIAVSSLLAPIPAYLKETVFADLPRWFLKPYSRRDVNPAESAILITLVLRLLIDGLAHPIVEEIYFRGYLMPRLSRFGAWCPVLSALFFALFHLWQPQNIPVIFLTVLPWMFLVWWKRNVYLSMFIHCLGNTVGATAALVEFLSRG